MKILFLTHYFPPEGNAPASRTYDNCKRWVMAGHDVTVLTCAPNVPNGKVYEGYKNRPWQREEIDGISVIRVWTFIAPNKGAFRRILNYLSYFVAAFFAGLFLPRPDILIATSPQFFCGLAGMLLAKVRRLPRILEIRDIWPESIHAVGAMRKSFLTNMLERLELFMYSSADKIVTVGTGYRDKLLERGVSSENIRVITNGADLNFYSPGRPDADIQARYGLVEKFTAAYVGTIGMAAGLEVALDASRILESEGDDSIRFLLVGDGAEREMLELEVNADSLKHVIFTGRIDKSEVPNLLRTVDVCFIHLRKSDLFKTVLPSKMFEAFAVGRSIILGVDGNAREVLDSANAGIFIEPGNAQELVKAMQVLRNNEKQRSMFEENGLHHVKEFYDRNVLAKDFLKILEETLKEKL
ncbi:glycosyltransferase family 4 protein [Rubellicoccus peritrichatus]|uniref:Glycosyltransferase family 4 protein n=1 Tax=Rubellicoccus peritrichatus TaxID=3080537 RepID=A0AAQ3LBA4_9BACT|nr:glycosyltransferase family 4 protein [Puniceicoccus sp. CR14]WOO42929.1 glycosyltransferase family 4 protein [Puniceicoccus sp. CR14]